MSELERAFVLIVDDEPDQRVPFAGALESSLDVEVEHPNDVTCNQISLANLVLVDYRLNNWPERDNLRQVALRVPNGLALTGTLRAIAEADHENHSPAFALLSAHLNDISPDFPPNHRPHIIAQTLNLEWVFQKGNLKRTAPQITVLAEAMKKLPRSWRHEDYVGTLSQLKELLDLQEDMPGSLLAMEDVEKSHPPIHELSEVSHGLSIVRWLLHRILPYPAFLLDHMYLAARLRIEPATLNVEEGLIRRIFQKVEYSGILANFLGPRWWRSGVEAWIWEMTSGQPHRPEKIHQALADLGVHNVRPVAGNRELVCISGTDYQTLPELYRIGDAVQIQPDHWPPYADQAWTSIEMAKADPGLRALVIHDETERLS